jgi:hypothetical protein
MDICLSSSTDDDDKEKDKINATRKLETTMIDACAQVQRTLLWHNCTPLPLLRQSSHQH